jgi:hypothetical protein
LPGRPRNLPLEVAKARVTVVDLNGQPAPSGCPRHGFARHPALLDPVAFEPKVKVVGAGDVFLDHTPRQIGGAIGFRHGRSRNSCKDVTRGTNRPVLPAIMRTT